MHFKALMVRGRPAEYVVATKFADLASKFAKAADLEPFAYLRRAFTELPRATTVEDFEAALAARLSPQQSTQRPN